MNISLLSIIKHRWPVILDPMTTITSLIFITLFLKVFSLEEYGEFIVLSSLFHFALNHNWGFDSTAKSLAGEKSFNGITLITCIYMLSILTCAFLLIMGNILYLFLEIINFNQFLFIISAIFQLSTATIGIKFLEASKIENERVLAFTLNNANFLALIAVAGVESSVEIFYIVRLVIIIALSCIFHTYFVRHIINSSVLIGLRSSINKILARQLKYYISGLNANVVWTLNPIILSFITTESFIAIFSIYFRLAGVFLGLLGYFNSWTVAKLINVKKASRKDTLNQLVPILLVFTITSICSFLLYILLSSHIVLYWTGQDLDFGMKNIISIGTWLVLITVMMPLNQLIQVMDLLDYKFIIIGSMLSVVHVSALVAFQEIFGFALLAFPIGCIVVSLPICSFYTWTYFKSLDV